MKRKFNFWIPIYRWQYIVWFKKQKPDWKVSSWPKTRLKAVYILERLKLK